MEPGRLRLETGLIQVIFYSGARVVIVGPTELQIPSPSEASCRRGRLTREVPAQASGFRIGTPQMNVTDLGKMFGLEVQDRSTELHVFEGSVPFQPGGGSAARDMSGCAGAIVERSCSPRLMAANPASFASLFDLKAKSTAAAALQYDPWRAASNRLNRDPSLLVHFDFERQPLANWRLPNTSQQSTT